MASPVPHERVNMLDVFENAAYFQQALMIILVLASVAALVVLALKLASGKRLSGGSAFLSGLRLGGPIIGLLGGCYAAFSMTLGVANVPIHVTMKMLAPGFAEIFLTVGLGFLTGVIAVFANWMVESRIDRQVLDA
jgi:biopolymer transport protein ExbB/TolQ